MIQTNLSENEFHADAVLYKKGIESALLEQDDKDADENQRQRRICLAAFPQPSDLAEFDQLSLRICNRSAIRVLVEMILIGVSEITEKECCRLFSGGREALPPGQSRIIRFPDEGFGFYGRTRSWRTISRIELVCKKEKYNESKTPIDVVASQIHGERRRIPPGPRLTEAGLDTRIDPYGLRHLFSGTPYAPLDFFTPPYDEPEGGAGGILAGDIMGQKLPFPIPWRFSPDGAHEWTHFLHRHHFLKPVLHAFLRTGDPVYSEFIENILRDWIRQNPVPVGSNGGAGPSWETLSVAWRIREWLDISSSLWNAWGQNTRKLILRSLWEHCRHLMDHKGHPNNWILLESAALALAGMKLPVFMEADRWRDEGLSILVHEAWRQFMADGVHFECSPLYHALCLHALLDVKRSAEARNIRLPGEFDTVIEKAADYLGAIRRPDFTWPSLNDSGSASGNYAAVMNLAGQLEKRPDFIWLGTRGKKGAPPDSTMSVFDAAGIAVMRSGWHGNAHALVFRAGPPGMSHVHEDVLSLDISVSGVPCFVDPGITAYRPGAFSEWYRSAAAHNMILVDGAGPVRSELSHRQRITPADPNLFFCKTGAKPCVRGVCRYGRENGSGTTIMVGREAAPLAGGGWRITDSVNGDGHHAVTVCWQCYPGQVRYDAATASTRYENDAGKGCTLMLVSAPQKPVVCWNSGLYAPCIGWVSVHGRNVPADHLQFSFSVGLPFFVVWEIRPIP